MTDDRDDGPPEPAPATIDSDDGTAQPTDMVRLIINDAPPVAASAPTEVDDGRGRAGGTEIEPFGGLPRDCPVVPLGRNGDEFFYLDWTGQVQSGRGKEHSGLFIINLYAPHSNLLDEHFPRLGAKNTPIGWDQRRAAMLLMDSCARHGLFEPASHLRERGAWLGEDGELVWHVGDRILVGDRSHRPGPIGEHVYPARPKGPLPTDDVEIARTAGTRLLDLFMSWAWRDPEIAARLMLGWVSAAMVGGALPWRPMVWVAGAHGTGKSTLHNAIGHVFNGDIIQSSDASAAGIWQRLRHSSLPIAIEEIEAGGHSHTVEGVIRLARQAASGGLVLRGGADHTASQFTVLSAFMFSSILIPPLLPQDRSRIAVLELGELPADAPAPEIRPNELAEIGAGLRRRLIDGWKRREDFAEGWRSALKSAGHSARTSDQYGTLLALADLVLTDYPPEVADTIEDMMMKLEPIVPPVRETEESDSVQCRRHLMGAMIAGGPRTEPKRVGELLCEVVEQVWPTADTGQLSIDRKEEKKKALKLNDTHKLLNRHGVRLFVDEQNRVDDETGGTVVELIPVVAVANDHQGLNTIFERFRWAGGTWAQSLKRLPGATFKEPGKSKGRPIQIGGVKARATFLPWDALELDDDDDDSDDG